MTTQRAASRSISRPASARSRRTAISPGPWSRCRARWTRSCRSSATDGRSATPSSGPGAPPCTGTTRSRTETTSSGTARAAATSRSSSSSSPTLTEPFSSWSTEEAQKRVVADAEFVNHENLEARVASRDDRWDLGEVRVADFGEDDVEAVVDVSLVAGLGLPRPDGFCDRLPAALPSVIADGGDASAGRCRGARFEIVGGVDSADIHVEMRMHVHSAGQYLEPGGVDFLARAWERLADLDAAASC